MCDNLKRESSGETSFKLPTLPVEARDWRAYRSGPPESRLYAARPLLQRLLAVAQAWPLRGRKTLIRAACRLLAGGQVKLQTSWGATFVSASDDTFLLQGTCSEPLETFVFLSLLGTGMTVIDVGANRGWYTLLFSKYVGPSGCVIALEPVPAMFEVLRQNLEINLFSGNVRSRQVAASSESGLAQIEICDATPEISRLATSDRRNSSAQASVATVTLDELAAAESLETVHLVKVDVEGAEAKVLSGASQILQRWHPVLLIEAIDRNLRRYDSSCRHLFGMLDRLGYRCLSINAKKGQLVEIVDPTTKGGPNWLCLPKGTG